MPLDNEDKTVEELEYPTVKFLLKQVYAAHITSLTSLKNENLILKAELEKKEREFNDYKANCKQCRELQEAFTKCKYALLEQTKLFENFGQRFSHLGNTKLQKDENDEILSKQNKKVNSISTKVLNQNHNNEACDKENYEKFVFESLGLTDTLFLHPLATSTFNEQASTNSNQIVEKVPINIKNFIQNDSSLISDPLLLVPDSLGNEDQNSKDDIVDKISIRKEDNKTSPKANIIKSKISNKRRGEFENNDLQTKKTHKIDHSERVQLNNEEPKVKTNLLIKNRSVESTHILSINENLIENKKNNQNEVPSGNKLQKKKSLDKDRSFKSNDKNKKLNENSSNLLEKPNNANVNQNQNSISYTQTNKKDENTDDFQSSLVSNNYPDDEGSWKSCDKKRSKKNISEIKSLKCTSKYKMTLDAPPLNFKKPVYKQMKLSRTIFKLKNSNQKTSECEILSDSSPEIEEIKSPSKVQESKSLKLSTTSEFAKLGPQSNLDFDATYIPENLNLEKLAPSSSSSLTKEKQEKSPFKVNCHLENENILSLDDESDFDGSPDLLADMTPKNNPLKKVSLKTTESSVKDVNITHNEESKENIDSFDKLPVTNEPHYKYKEETVRKKSLRKQLSAFDCKECEKYYSELGLTDEQKKDRLKLCSRHRAKYLPPPTPEHFWEIDFPDTQECKARGYLDETQKVQLKSRRRRPLS